MTLDLLRRLADPGIPIRVNGLIGVVKTPGGEWTKAKFWVTNDLVLVYVDVSGPPTLIAHADILGFDMPSTIEGQERDHYAVHTVDGETWELKATGDCGCGSSLPGFTPFPPPNRLGD